MGAKAQVRENIVLQPYKSYAKPPRSLEALEEEIRKKTRSIKDPGLKKAVNGVLEEAYRAILDRIDRLIEVHSQLPLKIKIGAEIEAISWHRNEDGSMWTRASNAPNLYRLLQLRGGKAYVEDLNGGKYVAYLTRGGYIKLYVRGERK